MATFGLAKSNTRLIPNLSNSYPFVTVFAPRSSFSADTSDVIITTQSAQSFRRGHPVQRTTQTTTSNVFHNQCSSTPTPISFTKTKTQCASSLQPCAKSNAVVPLTPQKSMKRTILRKLINHGLEESYHRSFEMHHYYTWCRNWRMGCIAHVVLFLILSVDSLTRVLSQGGPLTAFFFYLFFCDSPLFLFLCPICRKIPTLYYTL